MIFRFIRVEFFKLRASRTFLITVLGSLIMPILCALLQIFVGNQDIITSLSLERDMSLSVFFLLFGTLIINYLFTIDLETHTLKSIIPLPVSKKEYVAGKLITQLLWMLILTLITIVVSLIIFPILGMTGFELKGILDVSSKFLLGTIILFMTLTPLAFVMIATKNNNASLIVAVLILFLGFSGATFFDQVNYLPWLVISPLLSGTLSFPWIYGVIIIIATFLIGLLLSIFVFENRDITL